MNVCALALRNISLSLIQKWVSVFPSGLACYITHAVAYIRENLKREFSVI